VAFLLPPPSMNRICPFEWRFEDPTVGLWSPPGSVRSVLPATMTSFCGCGLVAARVASHFLEHVVFGTFSRFFGTCLPAIGAVFAGRAPEIALNGPPLYFRRHIACRLCQSPSTIIAAVPPRFGRRADCRRKRCDLSRVGDQVLPPQKRLRYAVGKKNFCAPDRCNSTTCCPAPAKRPRPSTIHARIRPVGMPSSSTTKPASPAPTGS